MAREATAVWAAKFVALLAGELGLPAGNLWEPPMVRRALSYVKGGLSRSEAEAEIRFAVGLEAS